MRRVKLVSFVKVRSWFFGEWVGVMGLAAIFLPLGLALGSLVTDVMFLRSVALVCVQGGG